MGYRLSKIYTRTGDSGESGLGDGSRVRKNAPRMEAMGTVDELNSVVGMVLTEDGVPEAVRDTLTDVQHDLFDLGGELSIPGHTMLREERVAALEQAIDGFNAELPYLQEFILPGGTRAAATCQLARAVCRRGERCMVTLLEHETLGSTGLVYLNRLSDLLFVTARVLARQGGGQEVFWDKDRTR